jgi:hypothetical protein
VERSKSSKIHVPSNNGAESTMMTEKLSFRAAISRWLWIRTFSTTLDLMSDIGLNRFPSALGYAVEVEGR